MKCSYIRFELIYAYGKITKSAVYALVKTVLILLETEQFVKVFLWIIHGASQK